MPKKSESCILIYWSVRRYTDIGRLSSCNVYACVNDCEFQVFCCCFFQNFPDSLELHRNIMGLMVSTAQGFSNNFLILLSFVVILELDVC